MASVIRYKPFNEVVSLRNAVDRLFDDGFIARSNLNGWNVRGAQSNLYETPEGFVLQVSMPGVNAEDVEITAHQDSLTLKWATSVKAPENATARWSGFANSKQEQNVTLPAFINAEGVEASYENGILTLNLPKAESAKARTIKVAAKN